MAPNNFLFRRFKERTAQDPTIQWCILKIDVKHIYDKKTLFSVSNAASNSSKYKYGITGDYDKFEMLFQDSISIKSYNGDRLIKRPDNFIPSYPTDEQAEVLVFDHIPYESVIEVCFESKIMLAQSKAAMSEFDTSKFVVDPSIFNPKKLITK